MESRAQTYWNRTVQVCLPVFTVGGFALESLKIPEWGVVLSLISQIFWLYASYRAWKEAKQLGMFINTIILTIVFAFGVVNYWFL